MTIRTVPVTFRWEPQFEPYGTLLGHVREVHPHYLLVGQDGEHADLEVPVHAIRGFADGELQVSVNRDSVTEVDDVETAHRLGLD